MPPLPRPYNCWLRVVWHCLSLGGWPDTLFTWGWATVNSAEKINFHCQRQCQAVGQMARAAAGEAAVARDASGNTGMGTGGAVGRFAFAVGRPGAAVAVGPVFLPWAILTWAAALAHRSARKASTSAFVTL
jgi:hypothetical protein